MFGGVSLWVAGDSGQWPPLFRPRSDPDQSAGSDGTIRRWDLADVVAGRHDASPQGDHANETALSPDGRIRLLFVDNYDRGKAMVLLDERGSAPIRREFVLPGGALSDSSTLSGRDLAVSYDGSHAAWAVRQAVTIADVGSGAAATIMLDAGWSATGLTLGADGRGLLVAEDAFRPPGGPPGGGLQYRYAFYRSDDHGGWRLAQQTDGGAPAMEVMAALPARSAGQGEGAAYATGDRSGAVSFWSADGKQIGAPLALSPPDVAPLKVEALAASADGRLLIVSLHRPQNSFERNPAADPRSQVAVIDIAAAKPVVPLSPVHRDTTAMALSVNGTIALVAGTTGPLSQSASLLVYEAATLHLLAAIPIADDYDVPNAIWLSPDGQAHAATRFLSESNWPVAVDSLLQAAGDRLAAWNVEDRFREAARTVAAAREKGDGAAALAALWLASSLRPDMLSELVQLGNFLFNPLTGWGDQAAAATAYDRALAIDPFDIIARVQRGRLRYFTGDLAGAEEDYRAAVDLPMVYIPIPRNSASLLGISTIVRTASVRSRMNARYEPTAFLGYVLYAERKWPEAVGVLSTAIDKLGGGARDHEFRAHAYADGGHLAPALADIAAAYAALDGGSYSGLDEFKLDGPGRQRQLCSYAMAALEWSDRAGDATAAVAEPTRIEWLRRAFAACLAAWKTAPRLGDPGPPAILSLQAKLAALGVSVEVPEVAVPLGEQVGRLVQSNDLTGLDTFRTRFAAFPAAAEAGLGTGRPALPGSGRAETERSGSGSSQVRRAASSGTTPGPGRRRTGRS